MADTFAGGIAAYFQLEYARPCEIKTDGVGARNSNEFPRTGFDHPP